jgi:cyclase
MIEFYSLPGKEKVKTFPFLTFDFEYAILAKKQTRINYRQIEVSRAMQRERITENIYWFQSELYAQVTAGVIVGPQWAIVVDTLALPEESIAIRDFVLNTLELPIRYLINTNGRADHAWGNMFFPGATIISHTLCSKYLKETGIPSLEATKKQNVQFQNTSIVLPHLTFSQGDLTLKIGKKNIQLMLTPGYAEDGISVFVEEDRVLFAGDAFMPIPQIESVHYTEAIRVIKEIGDMGLENIIQGHGDIILRGEIEDAVHENINYLEKLHEIASSAVKRRDPASYLNQFSIEDCGKSRVYLGGVAEQLHRNNLINMFKQVVAEVGLPKSDDEYEDELDDDDFDDMFFNGTNNYEEGDTNVHDSDDDYPAGKDHNDLDDIDDFMFYP